MASVVTDTAAGGSKLHGSMETPGEDSEGRAYASIDDMWKEELRDGLWYKKAHEWYEDNCPSTVDGVLGGFGSLDQLDVAQSCTFLIELSRNDNVSLGKKTGRCLDCGAGIGRVTKHLLSKFFKTCDLVESNQRLLDKSVEFVALPTVMGERFCVTLQDIVPTQNHYECIWVQWVIIYLTDNDFVRFLERCKRGLKQGGVIVIKENILNLSSKLTFIVDKADSSLTRSDALLRNIFARAGLNVIYCVPQTNFPPEMLPVMTYALVPAEGDTSESQ
jgi:protein N-terminal methyltransferase